MRIGPCSPGRRSTWDALWKYLGVSVQIVPEEQPAKIDWLTGKPLTYDVDHTDGYFLDRSHWDLNASPIRIRPICTGSWVRS